MAKKKKKAPKPSSAPKKRKSKLPDLITGKFIVVSSQEGILCLDGRTWTTIPADPYVFPSKTHAQAYIDGMNPELKFGELKAEKLSSVYGQDFAIVQGDDGVEKVVTGIVPKDRDPKPVNYREAVQRRVKGLYEPLRTDAATAIQKELARYKAEAKALLTTHKAEMKVLSERHHKAVKDMVSFQAKAKKWGGI